MNQRAGTAQQADPPSAIKTDGRKTRSSRGESLVDEARKHVLEDIIRGRLEPGSVVQLGTLADKYGMSRTPVREAIKLLEREGLITAIAYKGYLIRPVESGDVRDVFFMRRLLEGAAVQLAAQRIDDTALDHLRRMPPPGDEMTLDHDESFHDFHRTIVAATGSPRLIKAFENIYNDVRRLQYAGIGQSRKTDLIHQEHQAILEALEARDSIEAQRLMEKHIDLMRTRALEDWVSGR
ncbi:GntR family transcriptional regulator [Amycolatopsis jejuensis]|uniref:GntR family transcriptional regulator n=1 Tax=Amycolatopsis jejuensis TaxID=330084 RepID=UPI0005261683|nr:GntR family transcriptional regulator [Amycolatopsis jejuensis]